MQGPEHSASSTTTFLLSWLSGICHWPQTGLPQPPGRGTGRSWGMRVLWCTSHCQTRALTLISCSKPLSCIRRDCFPVKGNKAAWTACALEGNHIPFYPFPNPPGSHTRVWSGQNEPTNINPCSKSTSFLLVFLSQVPFTRPQKHPARCQHKVCASAKQQTRETWGGLDGQEGPWPGPCHAQRSAKPIIASANQARQNTNFPQKHSNEA